MGPNDSYANIRGQIINKKNMPSFSDIYNMLDQDQGQRTVVQILKAMFPSSAFHVTRKVSSDSGVEYESSVNAKNYQQKPRHVCTHCRVVGHLKERCYKLHGYPPGLTGKKKCIISLCSSLCPKDCFKSNSQYKLHEIDTASIQTSNQLSKSGEHLTTYQIQDIITFVQDFTLLVSLPTLAVSQASTFTSVPNST